VPRARGRAVVEPGERALLGHVDKLEESAVGRPLVERTRDRRVDLLATDEIATRDVLAELWQDEGAELCVKGPRDPATQTTGIVRTLGTVPQPAQFSDGV
jgi:hypothetical protein